jgi:AcrR family transcriptional regulator
LEESPDQPIPSKEPGFSDRERAILRAAIHLFAREGFAQTDVQEIADVVGLGKGTIYRHFGNKEALFLAAARFARLQVMDEVDAAAAPATCPFDHWQRGMRAFLRFFDQNPDVVELLIEERALSKGQRVATFFDKTGERSQKWRDIFQQLVVDGTLRNLPVEQIEQAISRYLFGTLFVNYFAGRPEPLEAQFDPVFDILFRGLEGRR